eukprot:m.932440 g.932440  ORF g.932440 m.932440 type:complete len:72 (-) comp190164_c0_seq1:7-222(-)
MLLAASMRSPAAEARVNKRISDARSAVEWNFGHLLNLWWFVDCLYGNEVSDTFGLEPPDLMEYFFHCDALW